ncbi:MAG: araA [Paenibacillus sp.]|jgi:L-arabinose isomerase|nr:araA [Paenibacillus sp.]
MTRRLKPRTANIGFFAVGHSVYWEQFAGLRDELSGYHSVLKEMLEVNDVEVKDYGMIDTSQKAFEAVERMKGDRLDVLFCNMITYATSSTFAPIIRSIDIPVILVALQPLAALDYTKASTYMQLVNDNVCSVPEFTNVAMRMGKKVNDVIIGTLYNDADTVREIEEWCNIAKALHDLKGARLGLMGHVLEAMYDMHADPTAISATFGVHIPLLEIDYVMRLYETVTESEIAVKEALILQEFDTPIPVSDPVTKQLTKADLRQAAHTAVALDKLVAEYNLTGLAYYYEGLEDSLQRKISSSFIVGNSLLNAQGIPMCGEYDIKTLLAMLIMDRLGIGGSFAEFHPFDFKENFILVGHDGPHHIAIAEGKPVLRSLIKYHGKPGNGASVEFNIKEGPITMLGITQTANGFKFVIGEGLSKKGLIPPTGNTNTRGFFGNDVKSFLKAWVMEGPTHHFALGVGHHAQALRKIGEALGVECVIVTA